MEEGQAGDGEALVVGLLLIQALHMDHDVVHHLQEADSLWQDPQVLQLHDVQQVLGGE